MFGDTVVSSISLPSGSPAVQLLSGRWTLAVLAELAEGGLRYQDLHDALDGISYKVLTETLRGAERDGLIARGRQRGATQAASHGRARVAAPSGRIRRECV